MKALFLAPLLLASLNASADTTFCKGSVGQQDLQINIEIDRDSAVRHVGVFNEAKKSAVFAGRNVKGEIKNLGIPVYVITGKNGANRIEIVFPEQQDSGSTLVYLSGKLPALGLRSVKNVELSCR